MNNSSLQEQDRLLSLDALRGLDVLFIVGLVSGIQICSRIFIPGKLGVWLCNQTIHAEWVGLTMDDLLFPIFVFISGTAMYLSIAHSTKKEISRLSLVGKLWKRAGLLVFFGCLTNGPLTCNVHNMRFASVLGLIGISCAIAGCIALVLRRWWQRGLAAIFILLAVGLLQYFGGDMTPGGCINARFDSLLCPGHLFHDVIDPEGPLCIVSASALCIGGMLAGSLLCTLRGMHKNRWCTAMVLASMGVFLIFMAGCSGPIIKKIWTPAFVLASAGVSYLLLALFHWLFDSKERAAWSFPLRVIGVNAIFAYLITHVLPFRELTQRIFCGVQAILLPKNAPYANELLCELILVWLLCFYLWRRNIFFKV